MSPAPDGTTRVEAREPCVVCGKPDWCLRSKDGDRAICARIESPHRAGEAGWVHFTDGRRRSMPGTPSVGIAFRRPDFASYAAAARVSDGPDGPDGIQRLSNHIGVSTESLRRLGVGWNGWAWTFPMTDAAGRTVGIRLRRPDGTKLAVKGSRDGLFVPDDLVADGRMLVLEGPTDTAAALDLGFEGVGRPSCNGGRRLLVRLVRQRAVSEVAIVADGDESGRAGANDLGLALLPYTRTRIVEPPPGIKDLRAWLRAGGRRADVLAAIHAQTLIEVRIGVG